MKKSREYVSRGASRGRTVATGGSADEPSPRISAASHPADLPRDLGMAGDFGAYEIPGLARAVPGAFHALADSLRNDMALDAVNAVLDALLPAAERHRVVAESLVNGALTLSLARRSDRFLYARTLLPRLRAALEPTLGRLTIRLMDR